MKKVKKILIAIDDESDEKIAIQQGIALAATQKASVHILAVLRETSGIEESLLEIIKKEELQRHLYEHNRSRISGIVDEYNSSNVDTTIEITSGISFIEFIRKAFTINADIIIQSSHPDVRENLAYSSVDWHLMRKSPIPVWVVKNALPEKNGNIVVAVDILDKNGIESFNKSIIGLAANLTHAFDGQLTIYSAWELVGEKMLRYSPFLKGSPEELDELIAKQVEKAQQEQQKIRAWLYKNSNLASEKIKLHLHKGNARDTIPTYVNENKADLLIMGTVNRTGIPGLLIGNTAEMVLSKINCSVVTLKPSLFEGPIKNYQ